MYQELTYDNFCDIIGIKNKNQDLGLSIRGSLPFYEKYRLGLDVINVFGEMIFTFRPSVLNRHISPNVFRILIHNNHPYKLNDKIKQFDQIKKSQMMNWSEFNDMFVSNKYQINRL